MAKNVMQYERRHRPDQGERRVSGAFTRLDDPCEQGVAVCREHLARQIGKADVDVRFEYGNDFYVCLLVLV